MAYPPTSGCFGQCDQGMPAAAARTAWCRRRRARGRRRRAAAERRDQQVRQRLQRHDRRAPGLPPVSKHLT